MNKQIILDAVTFLNKFANEQFIREFGNDHPTRLVYEVRFGRTYAKVIKRDLWKSNNELTGGSVYCFIDADLNVWKPASANAPAKNRIRCVVDDFKNEEMYLKNKIVWTGF